MPHLQPDLWPLVTSVRGLLEPHGSQNVLPFALNAWSSKKQSSCKPDYAPAHFLLLPRPTHKRESDFFRLLTAKPFPLSCLHAVTSASKAGSAHALKCERVHSGHLSLPSSQPGSLPLGFFSRTNLTSPILPSTGSHLTCLSGYCLNWK